jgi:NAD(P)-dependent dehydrogenase (short-subunit alcohol dehydrogenase family)
MTTPRAQIHGQDRPFGNEIHAALIARGTRIAADSAVERFDILVINRPVETSLTRFDAVTDADFDDAMADMLYGVVEIVQASLSQLRSGGRIVLVGSRGHLGAWGGVHRMAASAALAGLMRTMALELAARDIAVNLVAAGFVGTAWDTPASRRQVANAVCLLAEADTGLVGETIIVDGGRSLRMSESKSQ